MRLVLLARGTAAWAAGKEYRDVAGTGPGRRVGRAAGRAAGQGDTQGCLLPPCLLHLQQTSGWASSAKTQAFRAVLVQGRITKFLGTRAGTGDRTYDILQRRGIYQCFGGCGLREGSRHAELTNRHMMRPPEGAQQGKWRKSGANGRLSSSGTCGSSWDSEVPRPAAKRVAQQAPPHSVHSTHSAHGMCSSRHSTAASSTAEAAVVMASRRSQGRSRSLRRASMACNEIVNEQAAGNG